MTTRAYVAIGANLGDARAAVAQAFLDLDALAQTRVAARSSLYRSAPFEASGPDFINAVAALDTALDAPTLLDALQQLEQRAGRQRPYRNAPRTLDLDLLLVDGVRMDTPRLTLPHPRLHQRAFVLLPLQDLDPALALEQGSFDALLAGCADQAIERM